MFGINKFSSLFCVLSLVWGTSAFAVDGVVEINQVCAVNTGCFSGDAAGFPVTIESSGSYILTSSLETSLTSNAIEVTATDVDIDLNGFKLLGPATCTGTEQ